MAQYATGQETRSRLIQAAAEVFAEQGFRHTKLGDICRRAGTNAAAINYHFGDKDQLYLEVIRWAHEEGASSAIYRMLDPEAPPEEQLAQFVLMYLQNTLDPSRPTWMSRLMAREMVEPTPALDFMIKNAIRPTLDALERVIRGLIGADADPQLVLRCVASVVGQCMVYYHSKEIVERMQPDLMPQPESLESLAEHITKFSLAGIQALAAEHNGALSGHSAT